MGARLLLIILLHLDNESIGTLFLKAYQVTYRDFKKWSLKKVTVNVLTLSHTIIKTKFSF